MSGRPVTIVRNGQYLTRVLSGERPNDGILVGPGGDVLYTLTWATELTNRSIFTLRRDNTISDGGLQRLVFRDGYYLALTGENVVEFRPTEDVGLVVEGVLVEGDEVLDEVTLGVPPEGLTMSTSRRTLAQQQNIMNLLRGGQQVFLRVVQDPLGVANGRWLHPTGSEFSDFYEGMVADDSQLPTMLNSTSRITSGSRVVALGPSFSRIPLGSLLRQVGGLQTDDWTTLKATGPAWRFEQVGPNRWVIGTDATGSQQYLGVQPATWSREPRIEWDPIRVAGNPIPQVQVRGSPIRIDGQLQVDPSKLRLDIPSTNISLPVGINYRPPSIGCNNRNILGIDVCIEPTIDPGGVSLRDQQIAIPRLDQARVQVDNGLVTLPQISFDPDAISLDYGPSGPLRVEGGLIVNWVQEGPAYTKLVPRDLALVVEIILPENASLDTVCSYEEVLGNIPSCARLREVRPLDCTAGTTYLVPACDTGSLPPALGEELCVIDPRDPRSVEALASGRCKSWATSTQGDQAERLARHVREACSFYPDPDTEEYQQVCGCLGNPEDILSRLDPAVRERVESEPYPAACYSGECQTGSVSGHLFRALGNDCPSCLQIQSIRIRGQVAGDVNISQQCEIGNSWEILLGNLQSFTGWKKIVYQKAGDTNTLYIVGSQASGSLLSLPRQAGAYVLTRNTWLRNSSEYTRDLVRTLDTRGPSWEGFLRQAVAKPRTFASRNILYSATLPGQLPVETIGPSTYKVLRKENFAEDPSPYLNWLRT